MPENLSSTAIARNAATLLTTLRVKKPLVHNITNFVAMDISANVLLAIGASPAMVHAVEEVAEFTAIADALVINTGTLSRAFADSMLLAARTARSLGKPWVLDPVGAGATTFRNGVLQQLMQLKPAIIRGNASEIMALAQIAGLSADTVRPKGVDSQHGTPAAESLAIALARHLACTIVATGQVDFITDGTQVLHLGNGDAVMTKVTALGCALSALCAAFAAVADDAFAATSAALAVYGVAGEMAAATASGPGSFRTAFLDVLSGIGETELCAHLKVLP